MNLLGVTFKFDAAHFLPGYDGPCRNIHGHTWRVDFEFKYERENLDGCGIAYDFKILKQLIRPILPDHVMLNDTIKSPSAENLVDYFRERIIDDLMFPPVVMIRVWESEVAYAEWRA